MAFPQVEASQTSTTTTAGTNHTITMPASIVAGETLLIFASSDGNIDWGFPEGWTALKYTLGNGSTLGIAWRKADGTEGASITATTSASEKTASICWRISSASDPTVSPPEVSTGETGFNKNPDADAITPSGGSKDYLWIAVVTQNEDVTTSAYPTGYTDNQTCYDGGTGIGGCTIIVCSKEQTTTTNNPSAFTTSEEGGWGACSVVVYPSEVTGTNCQINIGDAWKAVPAMQINIGDTWKPVASAKINIGDAWKTVF